MVNSRLFWIIIAIVVAEFIYTVVLNVLNRRASHRPIPQRLEGVYDKAAYRKQQAYSRENSRMGLFSTCVDTALLLGLFALGGFAWFDSLARSVSGNPIVMALVFFGLFYVVDWMVGLPFSIYSTFHIEEKYGFPTTSIVTMAEVVEHLYNRPYRGKVIIDDELKKAIDAYYEEYGVK